MDMSLVIPVYNEEGNLRPLHQEIVENIPDNIDEYEVLFVDDGSTDSSLDVLKDISEKDNKSKAVSLTENFGQTHALQAGMDVAEGDIVLTMDADMQNDPADISRLVEALESNDVDMVAGWRTERKDPFTKRVLAKIASKMRLFVLDTKLHDYGCTLKAFRKPAVEDLKLYNGMHRYIPPLLTIQGHSVMEMPVNHRERNFGETKYGFKRIPKGFADLIALWMYKKFKSNLVPLMALSMAIIILLIFTLSTSQFSTSLKLSISALLVLIVMQIFISGIIANEIAKSLSSAAKSYKVREVF